MNNIFGDIKNDCELNTMTLNEIQAIFDNKNKIVIHHFTHNIGQNIIVTDNRKQYYMWDNKTLKSISSFEGYFYACDKGFVDVRDITFNTLHNIEKPDAVFYCYIYRVDELWFVDYSTYIYNPNIKDLFKFLRKINIKL